MDEWRVDNIMEAAENGFNRQVLRFIREGQDVNAKESGGYTPLFGAVFEGHIDTVRLLLDHGANSYIEDDLGYTALDQADEEGSDDIAELIENYRLRDAARSIQRRHRGNLTRKKIKTQKPKQKLQATKLPLDYEIMRNIMDNMDQQKYNPSVTDRMDLERAKNKLAMAKALNNRLGSQVPYLDYDTLMRLSRYLQN
jgi:ankyrin repeat protein